jgi:hypothetical protein
VRKKWKYSGKKLVYMKAHFGKCFLIYSKWLVVVATDLRWVWWWRLQRIWDGGDVGVWWRGADVEVLDLVPLVYGWCCVCDWLSVIWDSLTAYKFKSVEICRILFWVSDGFQICWDLQVSLYLIGLFHVGVDRLDANCELGLTYLDFHFTVPPSIFDL